MAMKKIPVIINNRDLLTWPKAMVEKIKTYDNVGEIIIIDNASTYKPLLDWYGTNPCTVIKVVNIGHKAPWILGILDNLDCDYYVVTDPDLGIENTPTNTLTYLTENLDKYNLQKLGLGLEWEPTPMNSPYFNHIFNYEKKRFNNSRIISNIHLDVAIDTTFAIYRKSSKDYFIGGACTGGEYRAKHYPWYLTEEDRNNNKEFMYYIKNASNSSSFKTFLNL